MKDVIPCEKGRECNWPACPDSCVGRPGADLSKSLLSRLQSLTGPDRDIDAEIALQNGWTKRYSAVGDCMIWRDADANTSLAPPRYTADLHIVLPLVPVISAPGGALWIKLNQFAGSHGSGKTCWNAELWGVDGDKEFKYWGTHELLPVALLIAIYRMREETKS